MDSTIKAIIVEDEKNGQEVLLSLLETFCPEIKIIGIAATVKSAYTLIQAQRPDLVFLDIILDQETSFDLLKLLKPIDFQIIFTTSSEGYAIKAFRANAVDYLMKPIDPSDLIEAVNRAAKFIGSDKIADKFSTLVDSIQEQKIERISIPTRSNGINIVWVADIIYIQGSGTYSTFHLEDGQKIVASNNLGHYQSILPETAFNRTHQSYLVNIKHIKRVMLSDGLLELSTGIEIPIARNRRDGLMKLLR